MLDIYPNLTLILPYLHLFILVARMKEEVKIYDCNINTWHTHWSIAFGQWYLPSHIALVVWEECDVERLNGKRMTIEIDRLLTYYISKPIINGRILKPWASLVAQLVKNSPAVREPWVWSLGWEDPLEKGTVTHSSILAWRIPWTV